MDWHQKVLGAVRGGAAQVCRAVTGRCARGHLYWLKQGVNEDLMGGVCTCGTNRGSKEAEAGRRLRGRLSVPTVLMLFLVLAPSGFRPATPGAPLCGTSPEWPQGPVEFRRARWGRLLWPLILSPPVPAQHRASECAVGPLS
ncbi:hypothetical protein VULLAG_LOCUS16561 [Vulpes lagopus]